MESTPDHLKTKIEARYFNLKDHVCVQLSAKLTGAEYQARTGINAGAELLEEKANGRAMLLCLDKSGSMAGKPFQALKQGAIMVAKHSFAC
jgi:hypothetical protein